MNYCQFQELLQDHGNVSPFVDAIGARVSSDEQKADMLAVQVLESLRQEKGVSVDDYCQRQVSLVVMGMRELFYCVVLGVHSLLTAPL